MAGDWTSKSLGEICEFRGGQGFPHKHQGAIAGEYPFIKVSDMELSGNRHRITRANHWIDEATRKELRAKPHPATSTVFAKIGVALTYNRRRLLSRPTIVDNNMMAAVPIESEVDPLFLYYLLKVTDFNEVVSGTALPFINGSDLAKMQVEIPPLPTQRAIAHVLGTLDDLIELNRETNEILEEMARALFKSWFVDFDPVRAKLEGRPPAGMDAETAKLFPDHFQDSELGQIPKGWEVGVLDDLTDLVIGGDWGASEPTEEESVSCFCIRGADIPSLQGGGVGKMPIRFLKASSVEKRQLLDNDLALEISGGSPTQCTGRPVLIYNDLIKSLGRPIVASNFCRILKLKSPVYSKFVYMWLRWLYDSGELFQFETGTTGIKNFAYVLFAKKYPLVMPDLRVINAFDSAVSPCLKLLQINAAESRDLAALRDTLLPKLLSGEVSVPAAEELIAAST